MSDKKSRNDAAEASPGEARDLPGVAENCLNAADADTRTRLPRILDRLFWAALIEKKNQGEQS